MSFEGGPPKTLSERLSRVPCLRNSYLYGICTGIGAGLVHFLFTSKPGRSTHAGFGGFVVSTMAYWVYCRHNYSKTEEQARLLQQLLAGELAVESFKEGGPVSVSNNVSVTPTNL